MVSRNVKFTLFIVSGLKLEKYCVISLKSTQHAITMCGSMSSFLQWFFGSFCVLWECLYCRCLYPLYHSAHIQKDPMSNMTIRHQSQLIQQIQIRMINQLVITSAATFSLLESDNQMQGTCIFRSQLRGVSFTLLDKLEIKRGENQILKSNKYIIDCFFFLFFSGSNMKLNIQCKNVVRSKSVFVNKILVCAWYVPVVSSFLNC